MHIPENRQLVLEKLKQEMNKDRTKAMFWITSLGLVEVSRKKVKQGLSAVITQNLSLLVMERERTLSLERSEQQSRKRAQANFTPRGCRSNS